MAHQPTYEELVKRVRELEKELSDQKLLESGLRESEEKYRSLFHDALDMIHIVDERGKIIDANAVEFQRMGYSREEYLGKNLSEFIHPDHLATTQTKLEKVLKGNKIEAYETTLLARNGDKINVEVTAVPEIKEGKVIAIRAILRDITKRKRMEEDLRNSHDELEIRVQERTAELERSNQDLQDFAYIASHDLQEPLRKVRIFGDRLADRNKNLMDDISRDYLRRMQVAVIRMQNLLDSLLLYSRATTEAYQLEETDLSKSVGIALSNLMVMIKENNAGIEVGNLPTIKANRVQIVQLFQNLISNAIKFHSPGETPHVKVYAREADGGNKFHEICMDDNGIGFDEDYLDKIFLPFQKLHGRSEYDGVGMGLAICRKIVERHGGKITARSELGKGSSFIISLAK